MNTRNLMATLLATSGMAIAVPAFARAQQDVPVSGPSVNAAPSASAADAQQVGPQEAPVPTEEAADIVVTGSSIRGVAPTGSSLVSVTRADIVATGASTTTELLRTVPQLGSFGGSGANNGQNSANFVDQPAIHGVGVGNGGGGLTLVLVDGLRLPGAGINQTAPDPSAIPPSAIERVEVVADGASSIYGSDAVAGVVNFILRKNVDGVETAGRVGFGDGYRTYNGSILAGKKWDTGSILADYEYSQNTSVNGTERDYFGMKTLSTLCSPANVTVNGVIYGLSATGARAGVPNQCDINKANDLYPAQHRHQGLVSIRQELGSGIEVHARTLYSARELRSRQAISGGNVASGGLNLTVTGGPFYNAVVASGVPAGPQQVTYNPSNDLGATVKNRISTETWSTNAGIGADLGGGWRGAIDLNYGRERDDITQRGIDQALVTSLVNAGTYNPYGIGTANDSALVQRAGSYRTRYFGQQEVKEAIAKVDGSLFSLPGGAVKAAVGGSLREERFYANTDTGPDGGAIQTEALGKRKSYSAYGELFVPIFGETNATTAFQALDVSLSARYDHYNDVGGTTNPKIGVNWTPVRGLVLHGSYGTSFHAPSLADAGTAIDTRVIRFADFTGSTAPGAYSIILAGGNRLEPETATTWSLGADFKPAFLPGFKLTATYFNIDYKNVITFPGFNPVSEPNNALFDPYRTYAPSVAQVLAATNGIRHDGLSYPDVAALPTAIYDLRRQNFARQKIDGLDFDVGYARSTSAGDFNVGASGTWLWGFDQQINGSDVVTSRLRTGYAINFKARGRVAYANGPVDGAIFVNYINNYRNVVDNSRVKANTTVDLHLGLKLPLGSIVEDPQITVDVTNLFDKDPPFFYDASTSAYGFDPANASALGRIVSVGLRGKF